MGFNPRSREGSDLRDKKAQMLDIVSIHAPVKGATQGPARARGDSTVSIHAPVKGATIGSIDKTTQRIVSIHAPVKGATA